MSFQIKERNILRKQIKHLTRAGLFKYYQRILKELSENPESQEHQFELLERRHSSPSIYSKRISQSNRVVYSVDSDTQVVTIFSAWGHYASGVHSLDQYKL